MAEEAEGAIAKLEVAVEAEAAPATPPATPERVATTVSVIAKADTPGSHSSWGPQVAALPASGDLGMSGWMFKLGGGAGRRGKMFSGSSEKKRFFVLDGPDEEHLALSYFSSDARKKNLGRISMTEVIAVITDQCEEAAAEKVMSQQMFHVRTAGRDYYFRPCDPSTYKRWVTQLQLASSKAAVPPEVRKARRLDAVARMESHHLHNAILMGAPLAEILELVDEHPEAVKERDEHGHLSVELAWRHARQRFLRSALHCLHLHRCGLAAAAWFLIHRARNARPCGSLFGRTCRSRCSPRCSRRTRATRRTTPSWKSW